VNTRSLNRRIRVLSVDGGGIRGIVAARILAEIERRSGKPASTLFDLMAGTSTGGILVLALAKPGTKAGVPAHSAEEILDFYNRQGRTIFSRALRHRLKTLNGIMGSRYGGRGIDRALHDFFGEARLRDALTPVLVTSYELERRAPFFFRSMRAQSDPNYDYPMKVVARCTSAAPTYFAPQKIATGGSSDYYALIDGGIFANNPTACAYVEAKTEYEKAEDFTVVSIGTGTLEQPILFDRAKSWGIAQWARPLLGTVFGGIDSTVDYQLRHLLRDRADGTSRYFRLQSRLQQGNEGMDTVDAGNLRHLRLCAEAMIRENSATIDEICQQLV